MAFVTINSSRYAVDAPISTDLFSDIVGDLNFLNGVNTSAVDALGVPLVLNGSFEADGAAGVTNPISWGFTAGTGGSGSTSTAQQNHGGYSYAMVQPNVVTNTGGALLSSNFMNVSPSLAYNLTFMLLSSRSDVKNNVVVNWYDASQSPLSSTTVYTSTTAPTSWTTLQYLVTPPAGAYFAKLSIQGGQNSASPPASTATIYWDGIFFTVRRPYSSAVVYTNTSTLTVPAGVFSILVEINSAGTGSPTSPKAYVKGYMACVPGDTITYGAGAIDQVTNTRTGQVIAISGVTATGGFLNLGGQYVYPGVTLAILTY